MKLTADDNAVLDALARVSEPTAAAKIADLAGLSYERTRCSLRWLWRFGRVEKTGQRYLPLKSPDTGPGPHRRLRR